MKLRFKPERKDGQRPAGVILDLSNVRLALLACAYEVTAKVDHRV